MLTFSTCSCEAQARQDIQFDILCILQAYSCNDTCQPSLLVTALLGKDRLYHATVLLYLKSIFLKLSLQTHDNEGGLVIKSPIWV